MPRKWPHFMEKKGKPPSKLYTSKKILGQLYDLVQRVAFVPAFDCPFDGRILKAYDLSEDMLKEAWNLKQQYDAHMKRIMAQHAIKNEFEVWSTFVIEHNSSNDFKFHEEIGRISTALKDQFRSLCWEKAGGKRYDQIGPFVAAMYKVTAEEMAIANQEGRALHEVNGREQTRRQARVETMPLMSFPWLFQDVLGKIAKLNALGPGQGDESCLIDSPPVPRIQTQPMVAKAFRISHAPLNVTDDLKTAQGITHRGDLLELQFGDSAQQKMDNDPLMGSRAIETKREDKMHEIGKDHASTLDLSKRDKEPEESQKDQNNEEELRDDTDSEGEDVEIMQFAERDDLIHTKLASLNEDPHRSM